LTTRKEVVADAQTTEKNGEKKKQPSPLLQKKKSKESPGPLRAVKGKVWAAVFSGKKPVLLSANSKKEEGSPQSHRAKGKVMETRSVCGRGGSRRGG